MISGKYYYEAMDDANSNLFDSMSETLENYVNEYYDAQKEMLSAKKEAIETEYKAIEDAETKAERKKELSELEAEREKYQNAVTIEGKRNRRRYCGHQKNRGERGTRGGKASQVRRNRGRKRGTGKRTKQHTERVKQIYITGIGNNQRW